MKLVIAAIVTLAAVTGTGYAVHEMVSAQNRHEVVERAYGQCLRDRDEWSGLVKMLASAEDRHEATIDFNHAIDSLDTAIALQKKGKLPPPEKANP